MVGSCLVCRLSSRVLGRRSDTRGGSGPNAKVGVGSRFLADVSREWMHCADCRAVLMQDYPDDTWRFKE